MTGTRMSVAEERKTARSLEKSLESTCRGLKVFLESLERAEMRKAQRAYQELQFVVLQQRLWSRAYHRRELEPLWRRLSEIAGTIHEIFAGFAAVMEPLKHLDSVAMPEAVPGAAGKPERGNSSTDQILEALLARGTLSVKELDRVAPAGGAVTVRSLVDSHILEVRGWGRGRSYRLTPAARQALLAKISIMFQKQRQSVARDGERI